MKKAWFPEIDSMRDAWKIFLLCVMAWKALSYLRDCMNTEKMCAWLRENGEKSARLHDWTPTFIKIANKNHPGSYKKHKIHAVGNILWLSSEKHSNNISKKEILIRAYCLLFLPIHTLFSKNHFYRSNWDSFFMIFPRKWWNSQLLIKSLRREKCRRSTKLGVRAGRKYWHPTQILRIIQGSKNLMRILCIKKLLTLCIMIKGWGVFYNSTIRWFLRKASISPSPEFAGVRLTGGFLFWVSTKITWSCGV